MNELICKLYNNNKTIVQIRNTEQLILLRISLRKRVENILNEPREIFLSYNNKKAENGDLKNVWTFGGDCGSCCVAKGGLNMTRIISITMAIIIMLTAGVNSGIITASAKTPTSITASVKAKSSPQTNKKHKKKKKQKQKHVHCMPKGNMGKWFKSKKALRRHVDKVMNEYNRQNEDGEITWEEYVKRCPYGYEAWSCPCGKWSGNFKYHKG